MKDISLNGHKTAFNANMLFATIIVPQIFSQTLRVRKIYKSIIEEGVSWGCLFLNREKDEVLR